MSVFDRVFVIEDAIDRGPANSKLPSNLRWPGARNIQFYHFIGFGARGQLQPFVFARCRLC